MSLTLRFAVIGVVVTLALVGAARADQIDLGTSTDAEIVATVSFADRLAAMCERSGGMNKATRGEVSRWEKANHVDRVRAEIARLAADPASRDVIASLGQQVDAAAATVEDQACAALVAIFDVPTSSFAKRTALLPKAGRTEGRSASAPDETKESAPPAKSQTSSATRALADKIEGFGFDQRPGIGYGGMIILDIYPVVLFKDGRLLTDVIGLGHAGGLGAHQQENPNAWTRWRKTGGRFELLGGDKWRPLAFNAIYDKVPAGFRLTGRYDTMASTGNIAIGGTDSVTVWEAYEFWKGGEVIKGRTAGADVAGGDYRTVAKATSPDRRGRYSIDGLTLSISYDDGASESVILVTDPKDPDVIWLNGRGFVKAEADRD